MPQGDSYGLHIGGNATAGRDIVGEQVVFHTPGARPSARTDVGVLTVINEEMQAVAAVLKEMTRYRTGRLPDNDQLVHRADLSFAGGELSLVAMQTLDRGTRAAVSAYHRLVAEYRPAVVLLVGIAGTVNPRAGVGDVVLGDEIIYYDARRETPDGPRRRGQSYTVPAAVGHRLNEYFAAEGTGARDTGGAEYRVLRGPIGSGDAVITDASSPIRTWLAEFHEKTLAVETEAAAIAQAYHEHSGAGHRPQGYLVIRGLSDAADVTKGYRDHALAARRAAATMRRVLPYLHFGATRG